MISLTKIGISMISFGILTFATITSIVGFTGLDHNKLLESYPMIYTSLYISGGLSLVFGFVIAILGRMDQQPEN